MGCHAQGLFTRERLAVFAVSFSELPRCEDIDYIANRLPTFIDARRCVLIVRSLRNAWREAISVKTLMLRCKCSDASLWAMMRIWALSFDSWRRSLLSAYSIAMSLMASHQ